MTAKQSRELRKLIKGIMANFAVHCDEDYVGYVHMLDQIMECIEKKVDEYNEVQS
jgi:hypothetical protein